VHSLFIAKDKLKAGDAIAERNEGQRLGCYARKPLAEIQEYQVTVAVISLIT
jgi:hypothetical protein